MSVSVMTCWHSAPSDFEYAELNGPFTYLNEIKEAKDKKMHNVNVWMKIKLPVGLHVKFRLLPCFC